MTCPNCIRIEKELELLKAQLREMREIVRGGRNAKRAIRKALKVGEYDRRRIVELLVLQRTDEEIMKELNVGIWQIRGIKALVTRLGGYDAALKYCSERTA